MLAAWYSAWVSETRIISCSSDTELPLGLAAMSGEAKSPNSGAPCGLSAMWRGSVDDHAAGELRRRRRAFENVGEIDRLEIARREAGGVALATFCASTFLPRAEPAHALLEHRQKRHAVHVHCHDLFSVYGKLALRTQSLRRND
ncbi:MAG: hypothetical protein WDN08_12240 [Rhizomicrobium sp.]